MRLHSLLLPAVSLLSAAILLSGCSTTFTPGLSGGNTDTQLSGQAYGGQQPIVGAAIYVYAASTTGYGGSGVTAATTNASASLITATTPAVTGYPIGTDASGNYYVTTDSNGTFKIDGSLACTVGTQIYLYSLGGNPGSGANTAAGLLAALGNCSDGVVEDTVQATTRIVMNEASTIATAYAVAGFATDATHIGALSTSSTLAATGIRNAFANANQMYSLPYGSVTARATTPNGNGAVPQAELNSLANILAGCVNSTSTGTGCTTLFTDATSTGTTAGTKPTDTATAAINIAHFPGSNVTALYNLASNTSIPFSPVLTAAPNDFTIQLSFTDASIVPIEYLSPHTLAIDGSGNVWNANESTSTVTLLSPLGVSANSAGFTTGGGAFSTAIDVSGNAWTANFDSSSVSKITPSGAVTTYSPTTLNEPTDAEFDGSGNLFVANAGANTILKATPAFVITQSTASVEQLNFPYSLALEPGTAGAVWAANAGDRYVSFLTNALVGTSDKAEGTGAYAAETTLDGSAVDASGNVWLMVQNDYAAAGEGVAKVTTANVSTLYKPGASQYYLPEPNSDAIDGASNIWVADSDDGTIYELSNAGTVLSPTFGYILTDNSGYTAGAEPTLNSDPYAIAVDGSGNVWYTAQDYTTGVETIREMVGVGVPAYMPLAAAVANSKLGQKP